MSFNTIKINFNHVIGHITMGDRTGEFPGMLRSRTFNFILISPEDPLPFNPEAEPDLSVTYNGTQEIIDTRITK